MTVRGGDKLQRKLRELLRTSVDLDGTVDQGRQPAKNQQNPISDCKIKTCSVTTCYNRVTMCYKAVADFLAARENTCRTGSQGHRWW